MLEVKGEKVEQPEDVAPEVTSSQDYSTQYTVPQSQTPQLVQPPSLDTDIQSLPVFQCDPARPLGLCQEAAPCTPPRPLSSYSQAESPLQLSQVPAAEGMDFGGEFVCDAATVGPCWQSVAPRHTLCSHSHGPPWHAVIAAVIALLR